MAPSDLLPYQDTISHGQQYVHIKKFFLYFRIAGSRKTLSFFNFTLSLVSADSLFHLTPLEELKAFPFICSNPPPVATWPSTAGGA